jgi:hypothetical protein
MENQASANRKQAGVTIFISDKVDYKPKLLRRDKGHYILIKGTIHQEDIISKFIHIKGW